MSAGRELYIGLMSGTSLDGVDAALVDFATTPPTVVSTHYSPYSSAIRTEALALNSPCPDELDRAARLSIQLADLYAAAVLAVLRDAAVTPANVVAIGCHGQTIRHRPELGYSIQLVDPSRLAEHTGIRTVADFRSRDLAAGGQGAPLVPAFHRMWFASQTVPRAVVNIGGIANVTSLPIEGSVTGFDTGPGNILLDHWAQECLGSPIDRDGRFAASGSVVPALLEAMLEDGYFSAAPPKSTGRDHFNSGWLRSHAIEGLSPADVQATLSALTAGSIAAAIERYCAGVSEVFVCGGGAHNRDLMGRLEKLLQYAALSSTSTLGLDPDWVEAVAFAWLARCAVRNETSSLPEVTGARGARVLGGIYPA